MKLALIGCGRIAAVHAESVIQYAADSKHPIEIVALIDTNSVNAEKFKSTYNLACKIFTQLEDAVRETALDSVIISVPHYLHEDLALRAFSQNLNVLLEKPMAHTLDSAFRILEQSRRSDQIFMIAENSQYWPEILKVNDLLSDGIIGEVVTAKASFRQASDKDIFDSYCVLPGSTESKAWRYSVAAAGGGITIDGGAHWIRPLRFWFGEIQETFCKFSYPHPLMEGESLSQAIFTFEKPLTAIFEGILTEKTVFSKDYAFRITGTQGEIMVGPEGYGVYVFDQAHPDGFQLFDRHGYISSFYHQFHDFYSCVVSGKTPDASAEYSLGEMRVAFAMAKSNIEKMWVSPQEIF
ncbi:MAG: Gfo/Idh/MocA family oxidoreductase [Deltaproteobacteria bacterium]|nr:Gfo/Idh/MocA family oxidoreductase [Deltaproteobacteria bacterium]